MKKIAVLFARADSIYKQFPECDVYDMTRDARTYSGQLPVIAHPPCRAWGKLSKFAKPRSDEKQLAIFAVWQVRKYGGILEHPADSKLWKFMNLPLPGKAKDMYGGFTVEIRQYDFYHKAEKRTWLYMCLCKPLPYLKRLGVPTHVIKSENKSSPTYKPPVTKAEREHTPKPLAKWLIDSVLFFRK